MTTPTYSVAEDAAARRLRRARRFIGGFYLTMGGVHLGIVAADPQLYRHFADDALFGFVRDQWVAIVMANPAVWGLLLFAGEAVIGMLMLSTRVVAVRVGWSLVIAFHLLLVLFGAGVLVWSLPVLAVVIPLARRDWQVRDALVTKDHRAGVTFLCGDGTAVRDLGVNENITQGARHVRPQPAPRPHHRQ